MVFGNTKADRIQNSFWPDTISIITRHETKWSHVKIHATCQKNIGNSIRKRKAYTINQENIENSLIQELITK